MEGRPLDEQELIARSREGDADAFAELVRLHQGVALRVAYLVVRSHQEAEDVTQEALVKAYRALPRFREGSPFRPWLLRIVRNEGLNRVRGRSRREALELRIAADPVSGDAAPSPETVVTDAEESAALLGHVDGLPQRFRSVIELRYLLGLSEADTAKVLGIPRGTVKSRTARALERLRRSVEER